MIRSLHIEGYRCFESFDMEGLGRINLLVGDNNSGKTSVLEALHLLASRGDIGALRRILSMRGERLLSAEDRDGITSDPLEWDISHLFLGHEIRLGSRFAFSAKDQMPDLPMGASPFSLGYAYERSVSFSIGEESGHGLDGEDIGEEGILIIAGTPSPVTGKVPLSLNLGIIDMPSMFRKRVKDVGDASRSRYIAAESLHSHELVRLWESITLTPSEEFALRALRFLEPKIEGVSSQSGGVWGARGGFKVKLQNCTKPVPIGSLGAGMWRMLAMSLAIVQCKQGVLLIDEIDSGLHYSVMSEMWKLIYEAAKDLDVQVFATTHSADCIKSLASICRSEPDSDDRVTLQRIEIGKRKPVSYSENEIRESAWDWVEVR